MSESFVGLSHTRLKQVEHIASELSVGRYVKRPRLTLMITHSWERGTLAQALIELEIPHLSPFSPKQLQFPDKSHGPLPEYVVQAAAWVRSHQAKEDPSTTGPARPLLVEGSTADPFSLGIASLMTGMCMDPKKGESSFKEMVEEAFQWVRESAPKVSNRFYTSFYSF